jgi:signal transduction histidine kinase
VTAARNLPASGVSPASPWTAFRQKLRSLASVSESLPPDPTAFLQRARFVERGVVLPVKMIALPLLAFLLFFSNWIADPRPPRDDALAALRNFYLIYFALSVGAGLIVWGMAEISPVLLSRVIYSMAILDAALVGGITLITGGFDSLLFWVFLGLIIRNAASIPRADVQITVNLLVAVIYVVAGVLDVVMDQIERGLVRGVGLSELANEPESQSPNLVAEGLLLRVLLLVLMTACCYGIQMLLDRQRLKEIEADEFALKQQQLEAAGRLAAEIAHQLKNPLGIINNAAYTLQKTVKEGKTITQQIAIIREEVDRSDRIITDLMGYAKLAEGRVEKVDLAEVLDQSITDVFPPGAKFETRLHRDYQIGLPTLLGARLHFIEIFRNLLTNAREAMNGKGDLFVITRSSADFGVLVTIKDSGPGIPADKLEQIFEPYFTTKAKGSGLGLAIVKHNAELYGGSVRAESELGKGTSFTVILPTRSPIRLRK